MKVGLQELTQAIIAMIMVSVTAWNVANGGNLPDQWVNMVLLVVGFYFGRATSGTVTMPMIAENIPSATVKVVGTTVTSILALPGMLLNRYLS